MAKNEILKDVLSASIPINGGATSRPTRDIQVAKVIPLVAFIFGSWPINDIANGNTTDIPKPINENPSMVETNELIAMINITPRADNVIPHFRMVILPNLVVK